MQRGGGLGHGVAKPVGRWLAGLEAKPLAAARGLQHRAVRANQLFQRAVRCEAGVRKLLVRHRAAAIALRYKLLDRRALVRVAVRGNDRVLEQVVRDRAVELGVVVARALERALRRQRLLNQVLDWLCLSELSRARRPRTISRPTSRAGSHAQRRPCSASATSSAVRAGASSHGASASSVCSSVCVSISSHRSSRPSSGAGSVARAAERSENSHAILRSSTSSHSFALASSQPSMPRSEAAAHGSPSNASSLSASWRLRIVRSCARGALLVSVKLPSNVNALSVCTDAFGTNDPCPE